MSKFALLTVGKTHSGKTTFAREIASDIKNSVVIETDPIALFLRERFPILHVKDLDHSGSFSSPSLKFLVFETILSFALENEFNVIMGNANMYETGRRQVLEIIKKHEVKAIGLYLNYPEEILFKRIENSERDKNVLSVSKDFNDALVRQRERFQPPKPSEFDYFFEIEDPKDLPAAKEKILEIYNQV